MPDQGQMLDVWCWHYADVNTKVAVTPGVTTSSQKDTLNTTRYLHRNQCQSIGSYEPDLMMDPVQWSLCTLTLVCGLFCSWQGVPPQIFERSIWDHVGFYTIHTFLNPLVECSVKSFLKLIISFLVWHILLLSLFKSIILVASTRHAAFNLTCLLEVGQQA